jgi:rod shape-determining protein MreD
MRWFPYIFLAYVAVGLQIGLAPFIAYRGAAPNLVLLAVVFIAVNAPRDAALIGCFALGFLQDLVTQQQPGLFALSYGLVALLIVSTQQSLSKDHPLTHFSLAIAAGFITAAVIILHDRIRPPVLKSIDGKSLRAIRPSAVTELTRVLYTAILAPFLLGFLRKGKSIFGFQPGRRNRMRV